MSTNLNTQFNNYISGISSKYSHVETSEMGYRTEFEILMKEIFQEIGVKRIDHDAKSFKGNKPDYVIFKEVPILYIEVKDIGVSLDKIEKSEQMSRYFGYQNLVLSDYVEFRFYRNGERYQDPIIIAEFNKAKRSITAIPDNFQLLANTLVDFTKSYKEPIKSGLQLAKIMGGKAQRIRDNIDAIFSNATKQDLNLQKVYDTIKKLLIHDLTEKDFADMYAQTLVYGLFVARFHDQTPDNFSRSEARDLIPASNPFLRHFFDHIAGPDFNKGLEYIVNELCDAFSHSDVEKLMDDYYKKDKYGEAQGGPDPVIHFYEDFLKEYDPELRKKMGAYYTPEPVVKFIVRSVDQILKRDFKLSGGLADTTKTENGVHKVQVLDPATGTGTFYSKVIGHIYKDFVEKGQTGRWASYVHNDLLPRIHGFELMMAPYTIAHLKLSMAFKKTGFKYFNDRLGIYLTNSLEDVETQQELFAFGFAESIANESKEAAKIKKDTPIMVVVGNPPYSGVSSNNGKWISNLIEDYKYIDGVHFNEKKHWLNDDYVKFIRFAEQFIEKNESGIIGYINPHGFLDNPTFRGMRWHLLQTFDEIYTIDLHGNSKKKETALDGSKDENVFDIQQGVAITLFVKTGKKAKGELAKIYHKHLFGKRDSKFETLNNNDIFSLDFSLLTPENPNYFFVPKNNSGQEEYANGFSVEELFSINSTGIVTMGDSFAIGHTKDSIKQNIDNFLNSNVSESDLTNEYFLGKNYSKWIIRNKKDIRIEENKFAPISYRPFDTRYTYFDNKIIWRWRQQVMQHFIKGENIGLVTARQCADDWKYIFITNKVNEFNLTGTAGRYGSGNTFPLYLYNQDGAKTPNFNPEIASKIAEGIGEYTPEELFDYIYAVLHSPTYREKYKEFLTIDFPRVPYPTDRNKFNQLVKIGTELRKIHLMESELLNNFITSFPESGTDTVEFVKYQEDPATGLGKVWINHTQYFGNVNQIAWNFYIGGYQPAQRWLKDRKGRTLDNQDIEHYQKIIIALVNTDRLMKEIDVINI